MRAVTDWYHFPAPTAPVIVYANSTLINGLGRYRDNVGEDVSGDLAVVSVEKGKGYRMRLISMSCEFSLLERISTLFTLRDG